MNLKKNIKERITSLKMDEKIDRKIGATARAEYFRNNINRLEPLLSLSEEDILETLVDSYLR